MLSTNSRPDDSQRRQVPLAEVERLLIAYKESGDRALRDEAIELVRRSRVEMQPDHMFGQATARLAEAIALRMNG